MVSVTSGGPSVGELVDGVWRPAASDLRRSRLLDFWRFAGCDTLSELDDRARRDPGWFWGRAVDWLELDWRTPPSAVVAGLDDPAEAEWFPAGRFNLADNAVDRWVRRGRGADLALISEAESGERRTLTFAELAAEVDRVAGGLSALGLGVGDRVGIQLPMVAEAAVAQLACAKIGVIAVPVFSGFGAGAVIERLRLAGAKAHILADGFDRRGRTVALRATCRRLAEAALPELRTFVVVSLAGISEPALPGEVAWSELGAAEPVAAADLPARHPLMLAFTSGTTGAPKGTVLTHAGFGVKAATDAAWCFDVRPGDIATWVTDPGWVMSPITLLGGLLAGSAVAMYGGAVDHPNPGRLWRVVADNRVTMLGVSPTLVRSLMAAGDGALPSDLGALRVLVSSGEPWTLDAYMWLFDRACRRRLPIINYSGGTEVSGAILSNTTAQPIHPCGFAGSVPGMAADVVDDDGGPLRGEVGELVLRRPSPGMTDGFWGDRDRYRSTYWARWPGVWHHGDWAEIDDNGIWYIRGRSDETLKIAGKRLGPAEVESAVNAHPSVIESAAVGVPDPVKGEGVVVFARPRNGHRGDEDLRAQLVTLIVDRLGKALGPKAVLLVDDLPRTRSGKLLRRIVRDAYLGEPLGDLGSAENPAAVEAVRAAR